MSKYIRTEKGYIYEYVEQRIHPNQYLKFGQYRHNINSEYEQIIAQADTIEELCDEFVIKHIQGEKPYLPDNFKKELIAVDKQDIFKYGVQNLYGAIWTDKGLIYVAKMNDKGELELL